ncbi:hypothetical protein GGR57DRAFT_516023, partial [Xylariaceae sp. FL1272]
MESPTFPLEMKDPNDVGLPPQTLAKSGLTNAQWRDLEYTSRFALPRFLFRGFSKDSGGGIDPKLNSKHGIIPHDFLEGKPPTTIYDSTNLKGMIDAHLGGSQYCSSDFSSWAADIWVALSVVAQTIRLGFSGRHIAVLDTSRLEDHVRAYHVPSLNEAGLAYDSWDEEYLVYGPIRGAAFHCVRYEDLEKAGLKTIMGHSPPSMRLADYETSIKTAKEVARLFRPAGMPSSEVFITVVVALMCRHPPPSAEARDQMLKTLLKHLSADMKAVHLPAQGHKAQHFGLVNRNTYAGAPGSSFAIALDYLRQIEDVIKRDRANAVSQVDDTEG